MSSKAVLTLQSDSIREIRTRNRLWEEVTHKCNWGWCRWHRHMFGPRNPLSNCPRNLHSVCSTGCTSQTTSHWGPAGPGRSCQTVGTGGKGRTRCHWCSRLTPIGWGDRWPRAASLWTPSPTPAQFCSSSKSAQNTLARPPQHPCRRPFETLQNSSKMIRSEYRKKGNWAKVMSRLECVDKLVPRLWGAVSESLQQVSQLDESGAKVRKKT